MRARREDGIYIIYDSERVDGGGGGGHPPGMEQRVAKLEEGMTDIKVTLGRLEPTLARIDAGVRKLETDAAELKGRITGIEGQIRQLPTALQIVAIILAVNAAAITLGGFAIATLRKLGLI